MIEYFPPAASHHPGAPHLRLALQAATAAGAEIVEQRATQNFTVSSKLSRRDLVTSADLAADQIICETIRGEFSQDTILSEESAPNLSFDNLLGPLWVVDPVDGTVNYAHNHFHVAVSIAYFENGKAVAGVVHCPFLQETFCALAGGGAYKNGEPISVSSAEELATALIGTGFPYERPDIDQLAARARAVLENCQDIRRTGAGAVDICWVACGRLDGFYETLCPWDIGAARLIVCEAGGVIDHLEPSPIQIPEELNAHQFVAANPALLPKLKAMLIQATG